MHVHPSADSRRCIVPGFLNLRLVEIVLSADPARAVYVQSPMHGVHTWPKVLVWTPETLRASQSERDTSVPCCLYLSEDSNALDYISRGGARSARQGLRGAEGVRLRGAGRAGRDKQQGWELSGPTACSMDGGGVGQLLTTHHPARMEDAS